MSGVEGTGEGQSADPPGAQDAPLPDEPVGGAEPRDEVASEALPVEAGAEAQAAKPVRKRGSRKAPGRPPAAEPEASPPIEDPAEGPAAAPSAGATLQASELDDLLGPVRVKVPVPRDYKPDELSRHPLLRVELTDFAGPLDLLVYLVRKHQLDVLELPIAALSAQYLAALEDARALEIDVAAEFLVLAAELTHIKSKMLLPARVGEAAETHDERDEAADPRAELVRRLLEYQKYRDAAGQLDDRDQLGRDVFARTPPSLEQLEALDPGVRGVSIFKLVEIMARLLRRAPVHHEISFETFSISERIHYVMAFGEARDGRVSLLELFEGMGSRRETVVTFIAVLEMTKLGLVRIRLEDPEVPTGSARAGEGERPSSPLEAQAGEEGERSSPELPEEAIAELDGAAVEAELGREIAELARLERALLREEEEDLAEQAELARRQARGVSPPSEEAALEPLPMVWLELTGKRFEGDILDDYQ